jgi:type 1 glutamine amidotransferase
MRPSVVVLAGEPEYDSQESMRPTADLLASRLDLDVEYRTPSVLADEPDFPVSSFGDLSVLVDAALLVVYTRFRRLPDAEMQALADYLRGTGAVLGLRTSNHAFHFGPESSWSSWNVTFGRDVLGSPWIGHHGHSSSTEVEVLSDVPEALVEGVPDRFRVRSWLYRTELADWCRPILVGSPVDPESEPTPGPVAWYGIPQGRRTFYTSLGHVEDLQLAAVQTLLLNGARWSLGADG